MYAKRFNQMCSMVCLTGAKRPWQDISRLPSCKHARATAMLMLSAASVITNAAAVKQIAAPKPQCSCCTLPAGVKL
jgi:hypothetical protein